MKSFITDAGYGFSGGMATFTATVNIATDDYSEDPLAGKLLWSESISESININEDMDWYPICKDKLRAKTIAIVMNFVANMTIIATKTGFNDADEVVADIVSYIEGGL